MKILQITSTPVFYPGGMEKVIWEISKRLSKKHSVTIIQTNLYEDRKNYEKTMIKENIKIITCKNDLFLFGYGYSKDFKTELNKIWKDYDIIHIHGCGRFTTDYSLKIIKNKPVIFTSHGFFHSEKAKIFKFFDKLILRARLKNIKYANALTEYEFKDYKKLGIPKEKIVIIPNGVDIKKFKKDDKEIEKLKKKFNLDKNIVLYVGGITDSKGLEFLVKAVKNLDCSLLLVGKDRGYSKQLKEIIKENDIKNVYFLGGISDKELIAIYFASDIFCLYSRHEGFGIVVIEAFSAGKPVIVSDRSSLPYIVDNNKNGFVVEYGNPEKLKDKIELLLKNKKLREKFGKEAKLKAKKYDWESVVKKYEDLYNKALKI